MRFPSEVWSYIVGFIIDKKRLPSWVEDYKTLVKCLPKVLHLELIETFGKTKEEWIRFVYGDETQYNANDQRYVYEPYSSKTLLDPLMLKHIARYVTWFQVNGSHSFRMCMHTAIKKQPPSLNTLLQLFRMNLIDQFHLGWAKTISKYGRLCNHDVIFGSKVIMSMEKWECVDFLYRVPKLHSTIFNVSMHEFWKQLNQVAAHLRTRPGFERFASWNCPYRVRLSIEDLTFENFKEFNFQEARVDLVHSLMLDKAAIYLRRMPRDDPMVDYISFSPKDNPSMKNATILWQSRE